MELIGPSNLISSCPPKPLIYLRNVLKLAQDYCFDIEPSSSKMKFNYIEKTIHHSEVSSKNVSNTRILRVCTHRFGFNPDRVEKSVSILASIISRAYFLEGIDITFFYTAPRVEYMTILLRSLKHTPHLLSMNIDFQFFERLNYDRVIFNISEAIFAQTCLESLKLYYRNHYYSRNEESQSIKREGFLSILRAMKHLQNLKTLALGFDWFTRFSDIAINELSRTLKRLPKIQELDLRLGDRKLDRFDKGLHPLAEVIQSLINLEKFKIKFIGDDELEILSDGLFESLSCLPYLKQLEINQDYAKRICLEELRSLGKCLEKSTQLLVLILNLKFQLQQGIEAKEEMNNFSRALGKLVNLKQLQLYLHLQSQAKSNKMLEFIQLFAESIKKLIKLEEFYFKFSGINQIGDLLKSLQYLSLLQKLELSPNKQIDFMRNSKTLASSLTKLVDLREIDINLQDCCAKDIFTSLKNLSKLENLRLDIADPPNLEGFSYFIKSQTELVCLKKFVLNLNDFKFNDEETEPLIKLLENLISLEELVLNLFGGVNLTEKFIIKLFQSMTNLKKLRKFVFCLGNDTCRGKKTVDVLNDFLNSMSNIKDFNYSISEEHTKDIPTSTILAKHRLRSSKWIYANLDKF